MNLKVSEIFYSLQGEGARAGTANVFVRLQGCKAKHACYAMGIRCDTEFESGKPYPIEAIEKEISKTGCKNIIWTGGEPTDQLTPEIISFFKDKGYFQSIETSGLNPVPDGIDFVVLSPKVAEHVIKKNFKKVDELRYVRHKGQEIPAPSIESNHYFISPHSDGFTINHENVNHCIDLIKKNPTWKLSIQMHKVWNVL